MLAEVSPDTWVAAAKASKAEREKEDQCYIGRLSVRELKEAGLARRHVG